jgi:CubicO group peptidase (beta-lactamase class C family)
MALSLLLLTALAAGAVMPISAAVEESLLPAIMIDGVSGPMRLGDRMARHEVPGVSVAVVVDGEVAFAAAYGVQDDVTDAPVTVETLFQAGSISKPVSAVAALRLVASSGLDLDSDVNAWLTSWSVPASEHSVDEAVTLRRILTHSAGFNVSGFGGYVSDVAAPTTLQILDGLDPANSPAIRVTSQPGAGFRYSGGGYTVLQQILEDVSGQPFEELLHESVLAPAGMTHSTFEAPLPASRRENVASGHAASVKSLPEGRWRVHPEMAAAGLWSTPTDLARFVIELQRAKRGEASGLLSREMATSMLTLHLKPFGLGVIVNDRGRFEHSGSTVGYRCVFYAEDDTAVVIMTNGTNGAELYREIMRGLAPTLGWEGFEPDPRSLSPTSVALDAYAGTYEITAFNNYPFVIEVQDDHLAAVRDGGANTLALYPESAARFISEVGMELVFHFDDLGNVDAVESMGGSGVPPFTARRAD